ncbi:hypothetical protein ANN_23228 [Periplaneta americana]|uniref:Uncharacterized protein n=1 Tax=Periplaneta americana TaxID=6978 RepID=A0ABQ8SLS1_PERAM|nr:hypothetical protein ANN_23228 [Periplaneta americana]
MDLREVGYDDRDWINLAQDRDRWRAYHMPELQRPEPCCNIHCINLVIRRMRSIKGRRSKKPLPPSSSQPLDLAPGCRGASQTLRKPDGAIEKTAIDWNPQGVRKRGWPRKTWKRSIEEEVERCGKSWKEVKRMVGDRIRWRNFIAALRPT